MIYGVYGAAGFGREVMPILRRNPAVSGKLFFIDDFSSRSTINDIPVVTFDSFARESSEEKKVVVAVSEASIRRRLCARAEDAGAELINLVSEHAVIMDNVALGAGCVICPFVTLTSDITIGRAFHANIYSYVAHDCVIGDYVTFAPGVKCNGNVRIEDNVYIGTGAILKQGKANKPLVIGEGSIIGMGSVVTKDVPPGVTVVGVPARVREA